MFTVKHALDDGRETLFHSIAAVEYNPNHAQDPRAEQVMLFFSRDFARGSTACSILRAAPRRSKP